MVAGERGRRRTSRAPLSQCASTSGGGALVAPDRSASARGNSSCTVGQGNEKPGGSGSAGHPSTVTGKVVGGPVCNLAA
eukprot:CAMPEP_0180547190 /NCGR_PEP_ID=MMETSP1036_2-20121128/70957_1 /TAXON_ID=632150 /ORGANISM="Azadinium spinosum, Strain 3D9" /LENGTH=78 /DNA_ID=CAMNT_0022562315 /DNA_START=82 /DNA_END=318 /DNA_ORIENTATION=-